MPQMLSVKVHDNSKILSPPPVGENIFEYFYFFSHRSALMCVRSLIDRIEDSIRHLRATHSPSLRAESSNVVRGQAWQSHVKSYKVPDDYSEGIPISI